MHVLLGAVRLGITADRVPRTMQQMWRGLPWDSDFFGFPIGRIDLDGADAAMIAAAHRWRALPILERERIAREV